MWWDFDYQTTLAAYKQGLLQAGAEACERLMQRPGLPREIEEATHRNATWYARPFPSEEVWSLPGSFNPSIAADPNGNLKMVIRQANYTIGPGGRYLMPDADDGVIKTTNYLADVRVSPDAVEVGDLQSLDDGAVTNPEHPFPVWGVEDCRLFWLGAGWHVIGTVRDRDEAGICTQVFCPLDLGKNTFTLGTKISRGHYHDKNWMPVLWYGAVIDRVYPLTMRPMLPSPGIIKAVDAPYLLRSARGGAQVTDLDDQDLWLGLVHEAENFDEPEHWRVYTHRFITWDRKWNVVGISYPFVFGRRQIEFAAGMVQIDKHHLLISYGTNDSCAKLIRVKLEDVLSHLQNRGPIS